VRAPRIVPLSQHALLNVEGGIALGFVALLFVRSREIGKRAPGSKPIGFGIAAAAIAVVVALAFAPILRSPFLYDDYTHITDASHFTWRAVAQEFEPVNGRGLFFRPVGFFFYWLNYLWAGANPIWWHASSIALHALCACLTYALCRELGVSRAASLAGALLFALTGLSAETVGWIDARFDLMATALVLLSLLCICRYAATAHRLWLIGGLALGAAGMLCKESAYCLPLLIASLAFFQNKRRRLFQAAALAGILAALLFAYRWWALRGIGGYGAHFNLIHTIDALLLREWAILFFPFNWSAPARPLLRLALAATPLVLAACAWMARPPRRALAGCVIFIFAAALPVQHLLLLGPALSGSRVLYLGSVGWALLWAFVFDAMDARPRIVLACLLLAISASTLEHNLTVWRDTARIARAVCTEFGQLAADASGPIVVRDLPASRMGAVFLNNGFPQCVEMNSGVPAWRIQVGGAGVQDGAKEFVWNEAAGRIEEATQH
jgi:hypothetical protein